MIAKHVEITYKCPKCNFKLTTRGGIYDNTEFIDKIQQKINKEDNICTICKEGIVELISVICTVEPIINKSYYEIKWKCEECNTQWYSIEDLNPKHATFNNKLIRIKNSKSCINENCKSYKVKTIALTYHRKI
jgi:hypothetical protein